MRHFSRRAAYRAGMIGLVALASVGVPADAQTATQRAVARDTTLVAPPKQPDAVPRPAGPVVVPGSVRPALAPDSPAPVAGPPRAFTPVPDPSAPVAARAALVPEASANVAEAPPVVLRGPLVIVNNSTPPAGSTARCKDGSYVSEAVSSNSCTDKGGLGVILRPPRDVPPAARP